MPSRPTTIQTLLVFIRRHPDVKVVSSASVDLAMLMPLSDGDPLTGPRYLSDLADSLPANGHSQIAVLQGLFLLGDRRTMPLLRRASQSLDAAGHSHLSLDRSGVVYASMVDLFVEWLGAAAEAEDEERFGAVARSFCRLPFDTLEGPWPREVLDVERNFPAHVSSPDPGVTILAARSIEEYGTIIAPRLEELARRACGDRPARPGGVAG